MKGNNFVSWRKKDDFKKVLLDRRVEGGQIIYNLYPFTEASEIERYFTDTLTANLDYNFEEYCTEDDYYQPVVEDFEIDYYVGEWCKLYGFELVSCEGDGEDEGYEPGKRFW